jgi:integrase
MTVSNLFLFKRPNGFWYILYTADGRRQWKSTRCTERSDALKKLTEFKDLTKKKLPPNRLSAFTQEFLRYCASTYAKASVDIFKVSLRNLSAISGDCLLSEIGTRHVDFYKAERLREVSPVSVNVELRSLRTILNTAMRWNLIESNPFSKMQLVRIPETAPTFFTKDDFQRLMHEVGDHWTKDFFLFAVVTGLRRSEIVNLKWSDVNIEEKIAHIHSSMSFKVKAGKRRDIPLSDYAVNLLQRRTKTSSSEYVFDVNGLRIRGDLLTKKIKQFILRAGLNHKLHFHSLRHTFATWLVQGRVSIYEVQKLMGHSQISTTQIYSHLVTSELHDAVNSISISSE